MSDQNSSMQYEPTKQEIAEVQSDVDKAIENFNKVITSQTPDGGKSYRGPLWIAWHYLQVYSVWGERLPNSEETLKLKLNLIDPGKTLFFGTMLEAYQEIHDTCKNFLNNIFPKVVGLGNDLERFAKEAGAKDGTFAAIVDFLNKDDSANYDPDTALSLIVDLQKASVDNEKKACELTDQLSAYKTALQEADGKLALVSKKIDEDSKTVGDVIKRLGNNDPKSRDSLIAMNNQLNELSAVREHNVTVAATSPTYVWVFPAGTISAIVVATVFGIRAVQDLEAIDQLRNKITKANADLATALATRDMETLAKNGVTFALAQTENAIVQTTTVQNAWNGMASNLETVKNKLSGMTNTVDDVDTLRSIALIKLYARQAGAAWGNLVDPLAELVANPFIVVKDGEVDLKQFAEEVKKAIDTSTATR